MKKGNKIHPNQIFMIDSIFFLDFLFDFLIFFYDFVLGVLDIVYEQDIFTYLR